MASAFSASKSTLAQLTTELEDSLLSIAKMEKKGQLSKARATKARRAVQREYDDYCNAALVKNIVKKPTGGGGDGASTAPAGEEDQEGAPEAKKVKKDWPVNGSVKTLVAQEYASFEEGKKAISAAFVANTLYMGIGNHREAATDRSKKKPGGHGAGRGYLDWEFSDGTLGCRSDTSLEHAIHADMT